ncbi:MAG: T9SS type A sorting domain-containing protein [Bacteroidia bacterium]|nr:T9SS type A sorting domain-containing protein [Bacteroidia bacterium]
MNKFFLTLAFSLSFLNVKSQCSINVVSNSGYTVHINLTPVGVVAPSTCQWGYNYNINTTYDITFSGTNIPAKLNTLQASLMCGTQGNFFQLPLSGGKGTVTSQSNPWRSVSDCNTATTSSLSCNAYYVSIQGPGIPPQTITCAAPVPLPVSLMSFTAQQKESNIVLQWTTVEETNNLSFSIERSADGTNWQTIKTVKGGMNSSTILNYTETDARPIEGISFYRLKQTDVDGKSVYSYNKTVNFNTVSKIVIYPNPAKDKITINGEDINSADVTISDCLGNVMNVVAANENGNIVLNTTELAAGLYFININMEGLVKSEKVVITR